MTALAEAGAFFRSLPPVIRAGMMNSRNPEQGCRMIAQTVRWGFSTAAQIRRAVARDPERLAVIDDQGELTYAELDRQMTALAKNLLTEGAGPGTRVAILARNGRGFLLPIAAKGMVGFDVLLLNPGSSAAQLEHIIDEHGIDFLFTDDEFLPRLDQQWLAEHHPNLKVVVTFVADPSDPPVLAPGWSLLSDRVAAGARASLRLAGIVRAGRIIIMSSGTTGTPKGVIYAEPQTPKAIGGLLERIPWRSFLTVQQTASMFHAWGWANFNIALGARCTLVLRRVFDAEQCLDDAERYGVNAYATSVLFIKEMLEAEDRTRFRHLAQPKFIVSAGNAMPAWLVERVNARFGPVLCNFYGSTEIGQVSCATSKELSADPTTAGRKMPGTVLRILDDAGREVPRGQVGRIFSANGMMWLLQPRDPHRHPGSPGVHGRPRVHQPARPPGGVRPRRRHDHQRRREHLPARGRGGPRQAPRRCRLLCPRR